MAGQNVLSRSQRAAHHYRRFGVYGLDRNLDLVVKQRCLQPDIVDMALEFQARRAIAVRDTQVT